MFLHYVVDLWVQHWRKQARGDVIIVRFADDVVLGFQYQQEAQKFLAEFKARLEQFGLTQHPEKTRLRIPEQNGHRFRCKVGHLFRGKLVQSFRYKLGH